MKKNKNYFELGRYRGIEAPAIIYSLYPFDYIAGDITNLSKISGYYYYLVPFKFWNSLFVSLWNGFFYFKTIEKTNYL